jgi:hypothetical protein
MPIAVKRYVSCAVFQQIARRVIELKASAVRKMVQIEYAELD